MPSRLRLQITLFAVVRFVLHTGYRMIYPFLAVFARGLGVDLTTVSLALTAHNSAGIFGPFLAFVADSHGRKVGMLLGLSVFVLGTALVAIFPSFPTFFIALVVISLGISVFLPSMQAFIGDQVPYERRGFAIAMTELSWASAFILGMPIVAYLIASWGWVAPFPFLSGLALVGILLLAWTLPRDIPSKAARSGWLRGFQQVFSYGPAISSLVLGLLMTSSNETVNLVFGIWMEDSFQLKIAALGLASAVVGFAELSAEGLAGGLVDRLGKNRAVQVGLLFNCLAAALFPVFGQHLIGALVVLFLFYLTFEFEIVCSLPLITEVLPAARGSMLAISYAAFSLGRSLGALISPYLYQNWGIVSNAAVAILLNLIGLLVLRGVRLAPVPDLDRT